MGLSVDCIYMDFQKAFDTVLHRRLIGKLKSYNINEDIIGWIENFITGRTQQDVIGEEECSGWMPLTSGIPQGSVLGPMLFVIYINDLPETVRSDVYLFADVTKIFKVLNSENDKDILQSDLINLMDWSEKWLLSFHPDKCKHIHITRERGDPTDHRYYLIQSKDLEVIESEKDIGVHIDQNINFDKHISAIFNKVNAMFALLRRALQYIDKETFMPLYIACNSPVRHIIIQILNLHDFFCRFRFCPSKHILEIYLKNGFGTGRFLSEPGSLWEQSKQKLKTKQTAVVPKKRSSISNRS